MSDPTCVRCSRPMPDQAYADAHCAAKAGEQLQTIIDMVPAARDVAHGLSHRGGGGASGKPGSRLPLDLGATSKLDAVQDALTVWVDMIGTTRGITRPWFTHHGDPILIAAHWLTGQLEWMRHQRDVDQFLTDISAAARVVAGIARGPAAQKYLGPCGADVPHDPNCHGDNGEHWMDCECWCHDDKPESCDGDVYARGEAQNGRCRSCGAEVARGDREAWLDAEVRAQAFRASQIADAYRINVKTIRSWAERGQLTEHGRDRYGRPLYNVGDVLDLAAADAARRAEAQAKRARREAVKAEESENAA